MELTNLQTSSSPVLRLPPEIEEGNIEYKLKLIDVSPERFEQLVTQLKWRLEEGHGEAIYKVGVSNGGNLIGLQEKDLERSLCTLKSMASNLDADLTILRCYTARNQAMDGSKRVAEVLIRKISGKKEVMNYSDSRTAEDIMLISSKLLTLIDLAGHQKYFKTTILGLVGHAPHCFMFVVNARTGLVSEAAKMQLRLAVALKIPLFVVVNKIDVCSLGILEQTIDQVDRFLLSICDHRSYAVTNPGEVIVAASNFCNNSLRITPVFELSCTKGNGLDLLKQFLNLIPIPCHDVQIRSESCHTEFQVNETYHVPDIGVVVGGLLNRGTIQENDCLWLGPYENGNFDYVRIDSIHRNRSPCHTVQAGQIASLAFNNLNKEKFRKGMVLIGRDTKPPCACLIFQASVTWLSSGKIVNRGSQVCVFIRNIRQSAVVESITKENENVQIQFYLKKQPEYIVEGNRIIFRQGNVIGLGIVKNIVPLLSEAVT